MRIAGDLGARTIAFPAVSAGSYGWPLADAARIAVATVAESGASSTLAEARFVLLGADAFAAFNAEVTNRSRTSG
jgi:O-acetyl-ADP-ribose deacetylase (regulator of RNase III)